MSISRKAIRLLHWDTGMQNPRKQAILIQETGPWYFISEMGNCMSTKNTMTHMARQWLPKDKIDS